MTAVGWGQIYRGSEHDRFQRPRGFIGTFRDTERWLNLVLLFVALMAMSNSLERANWVDEMPSLTAAAIFGLTSGWVLAQIPLRSWLLQVVGMTVGLAWVFAIVMVNMELADPLLESGARARWSELWLRLRDWGTALLEGGSSSDPLPFVMMLVFATWAVSYLASWSVVRWRNAWVALIPPGFVLLTNISPPRTRLKFLWMPQPLPRPAWRTRSTAHLRRRWPPRTRRPRRNCRTRRLRYWRRRQRNLQTD